MRINPVAPKEKGGGSKVASHDKKIHRFVVANFQSVRCSCVPPHCLSPLFRNKC
jgi:hypothetical protein